MYFHKIRSAFGSSVSHGPQNPQLCKLRTPINQCKQKIDSPLTTEYPSLFKCISYMEQLDLARALMDVRDVCNDSSQLFGIINRFRSCKIYLSRVLSNPG